MISQYSYINCVNEEKKCSFAEPMAYSKYDEYAKTVPLTDKERSTKLNTFVCGSNKGTTLQCCNKNDKTLQELATGSNLINPILDSKGNVTEYQICKCTTKKCEERNCVGFKVPTKYEVCKTRGVKIENIVTVNSFINKINATNAYPDCYDICK